MNSQKFLLGGIVGGVVAFLLGYVILWILLKDFFEKNGGPATNMDNMVWWALIVGNLFSGFLLAYVLSKAGVSSAAGGASIGFIVGLLMALAFDLIMYGVTKTPALKAVAADVAVSAVMSAIVGAVVGGVLGSGKKTGCSLIS